VDFAVKKPDLKLYESLFLVFTMGTMGIDIWIIHSWWKWRNGYEEINYALCTPDPTPDPAPFIKYEKYERIVCTDGKGGTIIAYRSMTSEYHGHNVIVIHHYTRQAITQNREYGPPYLSHDWQMVLT